MEGCWSKTAFSFRLENLVSGNINAETPCREQEAALCNLYSITTNQSPFEKDMKGISPDGEL
jgi:hypothetical protein